MGPMEHHVSSSTVRIRHGYEKHDIFITIDENQL